DPRGSVAQDPTGGALPGMRDGGDRAPVPAGSRPPTEGTVTIRAVGRGSEAGPSNRQEAGSAPGEGTMTIRAPGAGGRSTAPGTAQPDSGAPQGPQTPQAPQPIPAARNAPAAPTPTTSQAPTPAPAPPATPHGPLQGPVQVPAPAPAPAPTPAPASSTAPEPAPAALHSPLTPGPGGGSASWAQQVHQLAQPDPQQAPQQPQQSRSPGADQQPVVPWKPPVDDPFQQLARSQASARPAGLGKRLAARLVDNLVLGAAVGAVALPLTAQALDHIDRKITAAERTGETVTVWLLDATTGALLGAVLGAFLLLGFLLEALPTAKWGRTLGKKLFGLDVRDIESHDTPSLGAALRRWLVYGVLGVLALGVVNVLWCLFDRPWRQCWHDKAARTFVAG
ncbi:RDD family protein, partial [Streptomyces sp. WZ.A104]|uniref:RDD family protein n=1 Tax=Streptomyces sp. WZ.A104 TaxID=2023771 RepID=UPI000D1BAE48